MRVRGRCSRRPLQSLLLILLALIANPLGCLAEGDGPEDVEELKANTAQVDSVTSSSAQEHTSMRSVPLRPMHRAALSRCLRIASLRPACPRRTPDTDEWKAYARDGSPSVFDYGWSGAYPNEPERNRPPRFVHVALYGGQVSVGFGGFTYPRGGRAAALQNGVLTGTREVPIYFGRVDWAGRRGTLVLAPGFPMGGQQGDHLIFRWEEDRREYALGLHAWEPFLETVSTLEAMVRSIP